MGLSIRLSSTLEPDSKGPSRRSRIDLRPRCRTRSRSRAGPKGTHMRLTQAHPQSAYEIYVPCKRRRPRRTVVACISGAMLATILVGSTVVPFAIDAANAASVSIATGQAREADLASVQKASSEGAEGFTSQVTASLQLPEMPSGCEIHSLACVLEAMGADVSADELLDYLPWDPDGTDFVYNFAGDPYGDTGIGYAPALVSGAENWLEATGAFDGRYAAFDLTGMTFSQICDLVDQGWPVMIWTTTYMQTPQYDSLEASVYGLVANNHCVVLYGASQRDTDGVVQVMDPLIGLIDRNADDFEAIYTQHGCMAMAILPEDVVV